MKVRVKAKGLDGLTILTSQGQELGEIALDRASNQLLPIKVSSVLGQTDPGNYPIRFEVEAMELTPSKEVLRTRDEKSTYIIPR